MAANTFSVAPSAATPENELLGRTFAGYQAWFHTNDPERHWSDRMEMFPDLADYPASSLTHATGTCFPDGRPVKIFESHDPAVIDVHFRWMQTYGIDGVGVQRFYSATSTEEEPEPSHLTAIRRSAEKYGRLFYIMYDTSGCGHWQDDTVTRFEADVLHNVEGKGLIASPSYAHAKGKPVICVWGLSPMESGRYPTADEALRFVTWLKERGYYVIGGLPDNSYIGDTGDYAAVYAALDMISPWTPGRFRPETLESWIDKHLSEDLAFCAARGLDYQPVMHAGFSWSNMFGAAPNATPRAAGSTLWAQARRYAAVGVSAGYFAMFDEYNEATAIMKAAADSAMLPQDDRYHLTHAADGWWLSSDFYLRLGGAVTRLLRGELPPTDEVPVPHSEGPVYWRNGFETRPAKTWVRECPGEPTLCPVDICVSDGCILEQDAVQLEIADAVRAVPGETCFTGHGALAFSGFGMSERHCSVCYRIGRAAIPVKPGMELRYRMRAFNETGDRAGIDLVFDDGSRLSQYAPAVLAPKGAAGGWIEVVQPLDAVPAGRWVTAVAAAYEGTGYTLFKAYIDDVVIQDAQ